MRNRVDPATGRQLKYLRYADRELLVMTGGDQENPVLERMHYDEIAARNARGEWISHRMTKKFGLNPKLEDRCWYSGVQIYLIPFDLLRALGRKAPWKATREHLVCERNGGAGTGESNLVVAGRHLNDKLGHNPLPVKVLVRQHLLVAELDRDAPTWATALDAMRVKISVEDGLRLGDKYPWQNWCYEPGTRERRMADDFAAQMAAAEAEFLALDGVGRRQWVEEFRWRW